jgi:hypothetical protein
MIMKVNETWKHNVLREKFAGAFHIGARGRDRADFAVFDGQPSVLKHLIRRDDGAVDQKRLGVRRNREEQYQSDKKGFHACDSWVCAIVEE